MCFEQCITALEHPGQRAVKGHFLNVTKLGMYVASTEPLHPDTRPVRTMPDMVCDEKRSAEHTSRLSTLPQVAQGVRSVQDEENCISMVTQAVCKVQLTKQSR